MELISFYLKKFEKLGLRDKNIKEVVISSINEITSIEINEKDLELNRDSIKIKKTGPIKSEIFIHKSKIENLIKERLNKEKKEVDINKRII